MADLLIETSQKLTDYTQRVVLDGREYVMKLQWNQRAEKWFLSIYDQDEAVIVSGMKVVANYPLGQRVVDPRMPPGLLLVVDTSVEERDPGVSELGDRVLLLYIEAA